MTSEYRKMLQGNIDRFAASNQPTIWVITPNRAYIITIRIINHPILSLLVI
jgi:hypothetical protein